MSQQDATPVMRVKKRNGSFEPVNVNKIVDAVSRFCNGLLFVDPLRVATKTISGLYDGATTVELDLLSIQTAALLTTEEPGYSMLAARLLSNVIQKEVANQDIQSFSQSIWHGYTEGLISEKLSSFVDMNARKLNAIIDESRNDLFEYFGMRTVYDRYLLRDPKTRSVIETPQYFCLRIACGLAKTPAEAKEWYDLFSSLDYLPSSPTLFNTGTTNPQLSSCFLLDSPEDDLFAIYQKYTDAALLSKFSGGIGVSFSRVRSRGSLIKGTNGKSSGIIPFIKTLDASVAAVNQGGRRKGAACVYLETWHADIEEFLELRDNTGEYAMRAHNLNLANWIPDIFMERVEKGENWSLFDPKVVPYFPDLYGSAFVEAYLDAEAKGLAAKSIPAQDLFAKMMRTLAQTGQGWMCFKDRSNATCNQTGNGERVHLSNLCTEILEVNSSQHTAVCNLGSINLGRHVVDGAFDFNKLARTVNNAVRQLDRVIDSTIYPILSARNSNLEWRPIGLGCMGLQDVFFKLGLAFDSDEAWLLSTKISEAIYLGALYTSCDLAEQYGKFPAFDKSRSAKGEVQFDYWQQRIGVNLNEWEPLRKRIQKVGLRNSLLIAIAPTATIASIAGCYECIEPAVSNLFKRETMSGEFLQINGYLVEVLRAYGLWNDDIRSKIITGDGSIQHINEIPEDVRLRFRTVWEIPQKALIDLAAARGAFIDQSQSLNLFVESPTISKISSMYMYAWKSGLKTTYYLRSRPATTIRKTTVANVGTVKLTATIDPAVLACSLENPEQCEACT
jgi:ribonucleoside-diphosphate reductase alpha chain